MHTPIKTCTRIWQYYLPLPLCPPGDISKLSLSSHLSNCPLYPHLFCFYLLMCRSHGSHGPPCSSCTYPLWSHSSWSESAQRFISSSVLCSGTIYNCSDGLLHLGGPTASWINWFKTNRSSSPLHQLLTGLGFCFQPAPQPLPTRAQHFAYMTPRHTCHYLTLPFSLGHAPGLPTFPVCTITSVVKMSGLGTEDGIRLWPHLSSSSRFHESSPPISTLTLHLPSVQ